MLDVGRSCFCNYSAQQPGGPGLYFKSNKFNTLRILLLGSSTSSLPIFAFSHTKVCFKVKNEQLSVNSEPEALLNSYSPQFRAVFRLYLNSYVFLKINCRAIPAHPGTAQHESRSRGNTPLAGDFHTNILTISLI